MDLTVREVDAYARGRDRAARNDMAVALWASWNGALYNGYAFGGKRLPKIEPRLNEIVRGAKASGELTTLVDRMRKIAGKRGLPPPKARRASNG